MPDAAVLDCFQLEAGGDETEISDVPALAAYLQLGAMDWKYKTEPQPGKKPLRNSIEVRLGHIGPCLTRYRWCRKFRSNDRNSKVTNSTMEGSMKGI